MIRRLCFVALLALVSIEGACADAWNLTEGDYRISLLFSRIDSRQEFNGLAVRTKYLSEFSNVHDGEYSINDIILRGSYGLTPNITFYAETKFRQATLSYVDSFFVQRANSGLGDIYIAGRVKILEEPFALSVQAGWKIPAADTGDAVTVALGNGQMDFDGVVSAGIEEHIADFSVMAQSQFGMLFRGGNFGDVMLFCEELGVTLPGGHLGVHASLHGTITQGPIVFPSGSEIPTGYGLTNNLSYSELTFGLQERVSRKLTFFIDLSRGISGRSTVTGNTLSLGITLAPGQPTPLTPRP